MKGFLERIIQKRLNESLESEVITMIIGSRQVGKSTLMQVLEDHIKQTLSRKDNAGAISITNNTFSYVLDDIQLRGILKKDIRYIQKDIELSLGTALEKIDSKVYIFIDEVQKMPLLFDWVKQIFDANSEHVKFILTGSSAVGMTNIAAETLAGRVEYLTIFPFIYSELLQSRTGIYPNFWQTLFTEIDKHYKSSGSNSTDSILEQLQGSTDKNQEKFDIEQYFQQLFPQLHSSIKPVVREATAIAVENLFYGGLPRVITSPIDERIRMIKNYISVYLEKEIGSIARNLDVELFGLSLQSFAQQNGETVNINQVSKEVGISRPSLYKYLDLLENTYLVKKVYPYAKKGEKSEETTKSILLYYLDTGILNNLSYTTSIQEMIRPDTLSKVLGSWLLCSLLAHMTLLDSEPQLYYWQDYAGHKIDLVFEYKDYTFGFLLQKPKDPRRLKATLDKFAENSNKNNVVVFYPYLDTTGMSLEYKVVTETAGEKRVTVVDVPVQFLG
jgi:predicted AAA+ superfamily ATPase